MAEILIAINVFVVILASVFAINSKEVGLFGLMFLIYHLVFFLIPAFFHVKENVFPFYSMAYDSYAILRGAIASNIFLLISIIGYKFVSSENVIGKEFQRPNQIQENYSNLRTAVFVLAGNVLQIFAIHHYGVLAFLVRRDTVDIDIFASTTHEQLIVLGGLRGLSLICVLAAIFIYSGSGLKRKILVLVSLFVFSIINFPLAVSRTQIFSYFIAFFILKYQATIKLKLGIFMSIVIGVGTIFPLTSHIARGEGSYDFSFSEYYTSSADFDGFQSFLNVINIVDVKSIAYGNQLIGAIFAFIPREYWANKPEPTGAVAAGYAGYQFTNTSAPIIAELYFDFYWIGVIFGGLLIGRILKKLDISLWNATVGGKIEIKFYLAIIFSFSLVLFRGSLMSVISPLYFEMAIVFLLFNFSRNRRSTISR